MSIHVAKKESSSKTFRPRGSSSVTKLKMMNDDAEKPSTATHNGTLPTDSHTQEASSTDTDNVDPPEDDAPKSPSINPSDEDPPPYGRRCTEDHMSTIC